jgi:hypothetical protein
MYFTGLVTEDLYQFKSVWLFALVIEDVMPIS